MNWLKWLYPGLGIKRWFFAVLAGMFIAAEGLGIAQNAEIISAIERFFRRLFTGYTDFPSRLVIGILMIVVGLFLAYFGMRCLMKNIFDALLPEKGPGLGDEIILRRQLRKGPHIVAIGGGTGLSTLLRGLKEVTSNISAIVTVTDDGGSSGRLRGNLGMPPPGDIRNCLVALADTENAIEGLFNYRFSQGSELAGHSLGNLLIAGLTQTTGDFAAAVQEASHVLAVRGQVLPVTVDCVVLKGEMTDGRIVFGETRIAADPETIKRVLLDPADCLPLQAAVDAIASADVILLGPGSLYTSVIPNLLVPGIVEAIVQSTAPVYYLCNMMTQPGETDGYKVSHHVRAIIDHCGTNIIDKVIVNKDEISKKLRARYKEKGAEPVILDAGAMKELPVGILAASLSSQTDFARHDAVKLVRLLTDEIRAPRPIFFSRDRKKS